MIRKIARRIKAACGSLVTIGIDDLAIGCDDGSDGSDGSDSSDGRWRMHDDETMRRGDGHPAQGSS